MGRWKKPDDERIRTNKPGYKQPSHLQKKPIEDELPEWDGVIRGPELPDNRAWHSETLKWWYTWRCSPQAMICTDTDWESMKIAALIHDRIMRGVADTALANLTGELRKREGMFGASHEDRQRLGMSINTPHKEEIEDKKIDDEVSRTIDYFERLNSRWGNK